MGDTVMWIGGWASGLAAWRRRLETLYPDREHRFFDAHAALSDPPLFQRALASLPPEGTLVAWSLGSLLVHAAVASGARPAGRIVSACPIFDFCGGEGRLEGPGQWRSAPAVPSGDKPAREGGWPPAAVVRMIRKLPKARDEVLRDFWELARGNSPVTPEIEAAWWEQARSYSLDELLSGLEALAQIRVDRSALEGIAYLASPLDPVAPNRRGAALERDWVLYPKGHLPFFDYPEILERLLAGKPQGAEAR